MEKRVREEIGNYFKTQLNRPEILNRIGENIVVFDFIRPDIAEQIFDKMVAGILARVEENQRIGIRLTDEVRTVLRENCTTDLGNGGRGVGNQLEAWLINPLARGLFDENVDAGESVTVHSCVPVNGVPTLTLERGGDS